jgi:hypothetical protein
VLTVLTLLLTLPTYGVNALWSLLSKLLYCRGALFVLTVLTLLLLTLPTYGVSALSSALFRRTLNISVASFQVNFSF